jgi:hypothetical protein
MFPAFVANFVVLQKRTDRRKIKNFIAGKIREITLFISL